MLFGMAGRVDLELASVILEEWLPQAQRWRAQVVSTGERIQVRPAKLKTAVMMRLPQLARGPPMRLPLWLLQPGSMQKTTCIRPASTVT